MGKTLAGIIETAVGIGLEFTGIAPLQALGTSLILSGVTTEISALTAKRPEASEMSLKAPLPAEHHPWHSLFGDDEENEIHMILPDLRRQRVVRNNDRFDANETGKVFE